MTEIIPKPQPARNGIPHLSKIFNNYILLSDLTHAIVRSQSQSTEESKIKFDTYIKTRKNLNRGGLYTSIATYATFARFCFKSNYIKTKVSLGILLFFWYPHIFILGSHLGVLMSMPSILRNLDEISPESKSGATYHYFINKLQNSEEFTINEVYDVLYSNSITDKNDKNYVANDYFVKNKDKYLRSKENKGRHQIFNDIEQYDKSLPYLDCLLTRYIYYNMYRFYGKLTGNK